MGALEGVDIWWAPAAAGLGWAEAVLTPDECLRAERMVPDAAERFVHSRGLLRHVLALYRGTDPSRLRISARCRHCGDKAHGKPFLVDGGPQFSLSRSGGGALLAVADRPVGVDLESRSRAVAGDSFAATFLGSRELAEAPRVGRWSYVLDAWTRKEAYLKGVGIGLAIDPRTVELRDSGVDGWLRAHAAAAPANTAWWLRPFEPAPGFAAALAVDRRVADVRHHDFDPARFADRQRRTARSRRRSVSASKGGVSVASSTRT